jgi:hypothetical protein
MEDKIFSTRDLYLAASLATLNFSLVGIDYQIEGEKNLPVGYFKFEESLELKEAREQYIQGKILLEPRLFVTNMHALKSEVTNAYKNPHKSIN